MFIETENQNREAILVNTDHIVSVKRQMDGDVFAHFVNGDSIKVSNELFDIIEEMMYDL